MHTIFLPANIEKSLYSFQTPWLLFNFPASFQWLKFPVIGWVRLVRIFVLFLYHTLGGKHLVFTIKLDINWKFFRNDFYKVRWLSSIPNYVSLPNSVWIGIHKLHLVRGYTALLPHMQYILYFDHTLLLKVFYSFMSVVVCLTLFFINCDHIVFLFEFVRMANYIDLYLYFNINQLYILAQTTW
jgi:hypothetical protein